jgi:hypothetical protein
VDRERLLASFWPKDVPLLDDDDSQMRASSPIVHIAACAPTQLAQEVDVEGSGPHGALTYYLVDRLREAQPGTSYRRIADDVAVRVSTACPPQTVWAEGALSRELFGARFQPGPVGYRARAETVATTAGHRYDVRVEAGRIQGLRVGSVLSLHAGDEIVGRAEVSQASGASSIARWLEPLPAEAPKGALRAIEETRPAGEDPLALHVDDPKVASALARSERVRLVADGAQADYALVAGKSGKLTLLGPGGVRLWIEKETLSLEDDSLAARLEVEFREELRYRALVGLAAEKGSLRVAGRFASPEPAEIERYRTPRYRRCTDASPRVDSRDGAAPVGQVFRALGTTAPDEELSLAMLVVENRDSRPIHVAVLSVSEDRQRNPIWPQEGEKDRVLRPGESVRVPVNVVLNSGWDADRPMRDRYLVLATLQPADFTPLARERVTRGDAKTPGMPAILALALERPQTRGVPRASTDRAGYGLDVVDLFVDPIPK